ncbi:hypothetical protein DPMN_113104 [Dreissena polymorpha]|uniref:Uncharacterized protein n=1 Tax=Dreissena polymorpha TaxID=45954 RepID=A0A9D4QQD3_DREPO|nr:hypothetical protein DPMN_113104 [Dreissena polymorpha]
MDALIGGRRMWSESGIGLGTHRRQHLVATSTGATEWLLCFVEGGCGPRVGVA